MEGSEVGLVKSKKRKELNDLQSEKQKVPDCSQSKRRKDSHFYLNEHIGHVTESTSNNKKVVPEASLGTDQQLPSPSKGNLLVVLALSAVQSEGKKKVQSKNNRSNSTKNNNVVQNMVEKKRAASKTTEEHEEVCAFQKKPKKKCSEQRKKSVVESGSEKLSETLVTNHFDQNLVEEKSERFDENISIKSLAAAEVNQRVDHDTLCNVKSKEIKHPMENGNNKVPSTLVEEKLEEFDGKVPPLRTANANEVQNQEFLVNKIIEAAPKRADKYEEVCTGLPDCRSPKLKMQDIKRRRHSDQEDKFMLKRGSNKVETSLVTSDRFDEKVSFTPPIIASEVHNKVDNSPICEVENTDIQVSEGIVPELPRETKQDVSLTRQKRNRKEKRHADQLKVDNTPVCGLGSESPADNKKDVSLTRKKGKGKEKRHKDKKTKNTGESVCQHVSDTSNTKQLGLDNAVPATSVEASFTNCRMGETSPSAGDIRKGTKDELDNRSISPETGQISQSLRKLLILDLNGLLVDIVSVLPKGYRADKRIAKKALVKRPFCDDFVKFCFETFNVGVWSSRTKKNVDKVVDFIMGDFRHKLLFCWHQSHCTPTGFSTVENAHKPLVLKEIKKLWDQRVPGLPWEKGYYSESNTLLLDDSPYKALLNPPHTAIFPDSYDCQSTNDNALGPSGKIRKYLENVARAEHVQKYVEQNPFGQRVVTSRNPSWGYYLKLIKENNFCLS